MSEHAPVEVTTRYVTSVDDLPAAWAFVMDKVDKVGPHPRVEIRPISTIGVGDMQDALDGHEDESWRRIFEVVVEGMVHESEATR